MDSSESKIAIYIGVMAYNEEKLIGKNLESILSQEENLVKIEKVYVVSSGSTDKTNDIVKQISGKDDRVVLIEEIERLGKAHAINTFLKCVPLGAVCVLVSGDVILDNRDCLDILCRPFMDEKVGMTSSRPIPTNKRTNLLAQAVFLLWELRHRVSLVAPKTGEVIAFRKVFERMPEDVLVDEAYIEYEIQKSGLFIVYTAEAVVLNKGPESFSDFIKQRKRIYIGHKLLERKLRYKGSTFNLALVLRCAFEILLERPAYIPAMFFLFFCEFYARVLGAVDLVFERYSKSGIWEIITTTKQIE